MTDYAGMTPGDVIRAARKKKKMSQRELAKLINVSPGAVGQWETDQTSPSNENWSAIRAVLSIEDVVAPSATAPYGGQIVEDPDELALLRFWRSLDTDKRRTVVDLLHIGRSPPN